MTDQKPSVLFVCVHNAGRSQMAAGYVREPAGDRVEVRSAGSMPADQISPVAVAAMREESIDITTEQPKVLTTEAVQDSDVVITMGCGDASPFFPGKRYEDWKLDDTAGQGPDAVRPSATTSRPASRPSSPNCSSEGLRAQEGQRPLVLPFRRVSGFLVPAANSDVP